MRLRCWGAALVAAGVALGLGGCRDGGGGGGAATAGGAAQGGQSAQGAASPAGADAGALPLILVHGMNGAPADWRPIAERLAAGRPVVELYAGDGDALAPGALPGDAIVLAGYYRERAGSPAFYADRAPVEPSIGACPVPRSDPAAQRYRISYAEQLERIVENVCRASGAPRVDLAGYSMGGVVARAYVRWRSVPPTGGPSRVRRLVTAGTPNHGINALEALLVALAHDGARQHVDQGEAAELDRDCDYWGGRSYMAWLNDGWDAFAAAHDIEYGNIYAYGFSLLHRQALQSAQTSLAPLAAGLAALLLPHPYPGYDHAAQVAEASGDGDGIVRVASARMPRASYPGVAFDVGVFAAHGDHVEPERNLHTATVLESALRRFMIDGETPAPLAVAHASVRAVDPGAGRPPLLVVEADSAGAPLAVQVLARASLLGVAGDRLGPLTRAYGGQLQGGAQAIAIEPRGVLGEALVEVRLYGLDGEVALPDTTLALGQLGFAPAPPSTPRVVSVRLEPGGRIAVDVSGADEVALALAPRGRVAGPWSPWAPARGASVALPAAGRYELRVRGRRLATGLALPLEAARMDAVTLEVGAASGLGWWR